MSGGGGGRIERERVRERILVSEDERCEELA